MESADCYSQKPYFCNCALTLRVASFNERNQIKCFSCNPHATTRPFLWLICERGGKWLAWPCRLCTYLMSSFSPQDILNRVRIVGRQRKARKGQGTGAPTRGPVSSRLLTCTNKALSQMSVGPCLLSHNILWIQLQGSADRIDLKLQSLS